MRREGDSWAKARPVVHLVAALDMLSFGLVTQLLAPAAETAGGGAVGAGALLSVYPLAQLVSGPILGALGDRWGRRPVVALSLIGAAASSSLLALAFLRWSLPLLFASRVVAGAFAANLSTLQLVVIDLSPPEARAERLGRLGAAMAAGLVLGPPVGGALFGLHRVLPAGTAAAVSLASLALVARGLAESRPEGGDEVDERGEPSQRVRDTDWAGMASGLVVLLASHGAPAALQASLPLVWGGRLGALGVGLSFGLFGLTLVLAQGLLLPVVEKRLGSFRLGWSAPALLGAGLLVVAAGTTLPPVLAGLALVGLAAGLSVPTATSLVARSASSSGRGRAMGLAQASAALAKVSAPLGVGAACAEGSCSLSLAAAAAVAVFGALLAVGVARRHQRSLPSRPVSSQLDGQVSRTHQNRVALVAGERGMTAADLARAAGLSGSLAEALFARPELLPSVRALQSLVLSLETPVESLLAEAPSGPSLGELFGKKRGETVSVVVCGAGNLGHVFAGLLSAREGLRVSVLAGSADRARALTRAMSEAGGITVERREGPVRGTPWAISHDPSELVPGADVILLCLPSFREPEVLAQIAPHVRDGALVGSFPAPGGVQWAAREALARAGKRATVVGLASIPWMCKVAEPGQRVRVLGQKTISGLSTADRERASWACDVVARLVGFPVVDIGGFLPIILNPANQLLHPGLMYGRYAKWDGTPLAEPPLFYEGATDDEAEVVSAMSGEIQALRRALEGARPGLDLASVLPIELAIVVAYGADVGDPSSLGATLRTNRAYAGIRTPMAKVEGGFVPDFGSRFFLEDIPFGLVVVKGIAELAGVPTPVIDRVTEWAQGCMGKRYLEGGRLSGADVAQSGAPQRYGYRTLEALLDDELGAAS